MDFVLAVDSGGTKTEAILVGPDGTVLGWGRCDVNSPESGRGMSGSGRSPETIAAAIKQAMGEYRADNLFVKVRYMDGLEDVLPAPEKIYLFAVEEYRGALMLSGHDHGVVALAGTGAFVSAITRDGRRLWLDGLGPNLGDYGSGYQIGVQAIRAAARSHFHVRHATSLVDPICEACVGKTSGIGIRDMVGYMLRYHDRAEIAALARIVDQEAEKGDQIAIDILKEAATGLSETLFDVVDRLSIGNEDYVLVGSGSICTKSKTYWNELCRLAKGFAPGLKPYIPTLPNVVGEAMAILREAIPDDFEAKRERLLKSASDILGK